MSDPLPAPLVPEGVDLRSFPWMRFDVVRLTNSEFVMGASREAVGAAFTLWFSSFHQVPAGTLPDNDRILQRMAGCTDREWKRSGAEAMHGWELSSDGRYHHETVAAVVLETWKKKRHGQKAAQSRWNASGHASAMHMHSRGNANEKEKDIERDPPPTPPATGGALVVAEGESSLEHRIMAAFMEKSVDKGLTWPPSEREHVTRLVERARSEPDPEAWIKRFLETAWRLKREGKGIWRGRPWMPRTFCGPKAITWVIEAMGESPNQATMEDLEWLRQLVKGK